MRAIVFTLILLLAGSFLLHAKCSERESKTKDGLLEVERRWVKALDARDQEALACELAPEFRDQGVYGEVRDRKKVIADLPQRSSANQQLEDLDPKVLGDTGIVRGMNRLTTPEGKPLADVRFTDVFVYRDGRWQAVSAQETLVRLPDQKR